MPCPKTWEDVLNGPLYIITIQRNNERLLRSHERSKNAGFTNINIFNGVDVSDKNIDVVAEWAKHGSPLFDTSDTKFIDTINEPYKQGTLLSHLNLWKHIFENKIPYAVIFEDDIIFHTNWSRLAPEYFKITPTDYDMCYIGHHCGFGVDGNVITLPVYCTHAYIITLEGAQYLYNKMINDPNGIRTVDCLINHYQQLAFFEKDTFLKWYVWNSEMFPDTITKRSQIEKDMGLIFQE